MAANSNSLVFIDIVLILCFSERRHLAGINFNVVQASRLFHTPYN